jgi:hypothetical protein
MSTQQQQSAPQSPDRGARVIRRAVELMAAGQAKGWSYALAKARAEIRN